MLSDEKLAELDEAEKKATPRTWASDFCGDIWSEEITGNPLSEQDDLGAYKIIRTTTRGPDNGDGAFCALSRNHLRELLDEVKEHRAGEKGIRLRGLKKDVAFYREQAEKLRTELQTALDMLELVELWDPYPDLSGHKYYDAFKYLRTKIPDAVKHIYDSKLLEKK